MGKGGDLLHLLRTGNSGEARKLVAKLKKQGKKKFLAAVNDQDEDGCTPLHYSAGFNFLDFIEEFLEAGAVVNVEDSKGSTPLHLAAGNGRGEAVSILLRRGADPNLVTRTGDTALHLASTNGHTEVVEYLVKDRAKCTIVNVSGQSPLDLASQNGHASCVAYLLHSGQFSPQKPESVHTALKLASKHGQTQVLSILIRYGFDINRVLPGAHGTCLHEAALYGKIETVHYLLQCGCDASIKNSQGLTALDIVNHYTDPRSAHQLKQILQDALTSQITRQRPGSTSSSTPHTNATTQQHHQTAAQQQHHQIAAQQQHHQIAAQQQHHQTAAQQQQQMYAQYYQQQAAQARTSQSQTHTGYPQTHAGYPQAHTGQPQAHTGYPQAHTGQPQTHTGYPQTHTGQPQATGQRSSYVGQPQTTPQVPSSPRVGVGMPGSADLAAMIAARAASRNPMTTSPTSKDNPSDVMLRSSTMSGVQRPQLDRSAIARRRNSYSEESQQENEPYHHSNPPTLPRRTHMGPPTFKPVPPPVSPSPSSHSEEQEQEGSSSPVIGNASLPLGEVKLRRVVVNKPPVAAAPPPPKEEPSFENELLAKLRRRQENIDQPAPPTSNVEVPKEQQPVKEKETTPPVSSPQQPSSPAKPAPKPRPKPKAKVEPPPPKEEKQLSWQEELARKKAQREKEEAARREEELKREEEQKREEEVRRQEEERRQEEMRRQDEERKQEELRKQEEIRRQEELKRQDELRKIEEAKRAEELRRGSTTDTTPKDSSPPKTRPKPSKSKPPVPPPTATPSAPPSAPTSAPPTAPPPATPTSTVVLPAGMIGPGPTSPSVILPTAMIGPGSSRGIGTVSNPVEVEPLAPSPTVPTTLPPAPSPPVAAPSPPVTAPSPPVTVPTVPVTAPVTAPSPPVTAPAPVPTVPVDTVPHEPSYDRDLPPAAVIRDERPQTPSSDQQLSRSTSLSSIVSVPLPTMPQSAFECVPIGEWLTSCKLVEYIPLLEGAGYDNTDFLLGITAEELTELGVSKVGHRKRMLSALGQLIAKEHFLTFKPTSVAEWLQQLGLSIYETLLIDSGYDDIDFITSVTDEELLEIGIAKQGHLKRFNKGIQELNDLLKAEQAVPPSASPFTVPPYNTTVLPSSPSHSISNLSSYSQQFESMRTSVAESETLSEQDTAAVVRRKTEEAPPRPLSVSSSHDSGIELNAAGNNRKSGNFNKMKHLLEKRMGIPVTGEIDINEDEDNDSEKTPHPSPPPNEPTPTQVATPTQVVPPTQVASSTQITTPTHNVVTPPTHNEPPPTQPRATRPKSVAAPPIPQRSVSTVLTKESPLLQTKSLSLDMTDFEAPPTTTTLPTTIPATFNEQYSSEDISSVLDETTPPPEDRSRRAPSLLPELDELDSVLQGFGENGTQSSQEDEEEEEVGGGGGEEPEEGTKTDQLLADIDDMLADLNDHLDVMIPGSNN